VIQGGKHSPKDKDEMHVGINIYNIVPYIFIRYASPYVLTFIFLLKCKKQAPGTVHCGYYVCYYLHANIEGKYLKSLVEHGANVVSITTLTYQL
jgi:hypothetical protein